MSATALLLCVLLLTLSSAAATTTTVTIQWNKVLRSSSRTTPTLQVVANPLLDRQFPVSAAMFEQLRQLEADFVRYVPWFPYPHYGVAELQPPNPTTRTTSWDFKACGPMMDDIISATKGHPVIVNWSTQPDWLWNTTDWSYPADPTAVDWSYPRGKVLRDSTGKELGDYYARLIGYLTQGGFTDEYGVRHDGFHYDIPLWEVFNEPEFEHAYNVSMYTQHYDIVTQAMRKVNPSIEFVALALGGHDEWDWYKYFVNASNHQPNAIMPKMLSFHFYASSSNRTDPQSYTQFFPQADTFVSEFETIRQIVPAEILLNCDETGVILSDDNDPNAPQFPLVYWNAAAANYAYLFGRLSLAGIDVLGESQLVGAPALPSLGLSPQYPSVAILNWTTGAGTARYWVLHTLIRYFGPGAGMVATSTSSPELVYAQAYTRQHTTNQQRLVLLVNKDNAIHSVVLPAAEFNGAKVLTVDEATGFGPPREQQLGANTTITMTPFAVSFVIVMLEA